MFIDEVKITVVSGKGWDGLISWRREKYIPKWGPWGGNGWKGWDVYLQTDVNLNTLSEYRHKKLLRAEDGERGGTNTCAGANAEDLIIKVPVWTLVKDPETQALIVDLDRPGLKYRICEWGRGGYGNANFCSSTRQAPAFAELGDWAITKDIQLELKLVADVGIIGIPSAGKSTLISKITNVSPKIGDYPFTTLTPNLGVLDHKWKSLVLEDVPGLIPGASEGKGLGIEFLKHIERTWVLLHLLDLYRLDNLFQDYRDIRKELEAFSPELAEKEEIIVLSKSDLLDDEMKDHILWEFTAKYPDKKVFMISAATMDWVEALQDYLVDNITPLSDDIENNLEVIDTPTIYNLKDDVDPRNVDITYLWDLVFRAKWARLEQIVRMTDFENSEAVMRVYDVLDKMQVIRKIEKDLAKILEDQDIDNSFFFEGWDEDNISPKIQIWERTIELNKLKYNL